MPQFYGIYKSDIRMQKRIDKSVKSVYSGDNRLSKRYRGDYMDKKISLKAIAEMCGVSVATVSRVINQNGRFSKETEERVRGVIDQYNYRPNQIAKGLRTNKIDTVGIIVPDITNEFFSSMILALQKRLFQENYSCIIFNTNESEAVERQCVSSLLSMNISGIVSVNGRLDLDACLDPRMPRVYVDRLPGENGVCPSAVYLASDHEEGAYLAGRELALCGCRTVACITALEKATATKMRSAGFERACREFGMEYPEEFRFVPEEVGLDSAYAITMNALRSGARFDGLFCQTDWLAIGALKAMNELGISLPEDMQLIGFDDIRAARVGSKPLTTVHQSSSLLGNSAANTILGLISGVVPQERVTKLPVQIVCRETTRHKKG